MIHTDTFVQWSRAGQMFCTTSIFCESYMTLTLFRMGLFRCRSRMGGQKGPPSLKPASHTYPTFMRFATVIPYLKKTQKIYKAPDTTFEFC